MKHLPLDADKLRHIQRRTVCIVKGLETLRKRDLSSNVSITIFWAYYLGGDLYHHPSLPLGAAVLHESLKQSRALHISHHVPSCGELAEMAWSAGAAGHLEEGKACFSLLLEGIMWMQRGAKCRRHRLPAKGRSYSWYSEYRELILRMRRVKQA